MAVYPRRGGSDIVADVRHSVPHGVNCIWNVIEQRHHREPYTHVMAFGGTIPLNAAPVFSRWLQIPLVTLFRGNDFDTAIFDSRRRQIIDTVMSESAMVCTVSGKTGARMQRLYPSSSIRVVANAIDSRYWRALPSDSEQARSIRSTLGIDHKIVLGFFGHLKKKKGVDVFIESLALSSLADHFHIIIVGDMDEDLAGMTSQHGSRVGVTHLPFVDQYRTIPYYLACDFVVLPSFYDGLPNVALEAAALSCVLIATESAGGTAFSGSALVPENSADTHSANIATLRQALCMTEEERLIRGRRAAQIVKEEYTPDKERNGYLSILRATRRAISAVDHVL